jgi:hypothetical protein
VAHIRPIGEDRRERRRAGRRKARGHFDGPYRPKSLSGRWESISVLGILPLTIHEVYNHFRRTVNSGKWLFMPGLNCLRHSFISACASKGLDQRIIEEWVGHQTEKQRRRYGRLYPSAQRAAIRMFLISDLEPRQLGALAMKPLVFRQNRTSFSLTEIHGSHQGSARARLSSPGYVVRQSFIGRLQDYAGRSGAAPLVARRRHWQVPWLGEGCAAARVAWCPRLGQFRRPNLRPCCGRLG